MFRRRRRQRRAGVAPGADGNRGVNCTDVAKSAAGIVLTKPGLGVDRRFRKRRLRDVPAHPDFRSAPEEQTHHLMHLQRQLPRSPQLVPFQTFRND
jgi:hypothetical protein